MEKLTPEMISAIQYGTERRDIEFKPPFKWQESSRSYRIEVVRAAMSFSNIAGGGNIIIGISQGQDRRQGVIYNRVGLSNEQFNSFDVPDDIGRFVSDKSNQPVRFVLHGGSIEGMAGDNTYVVIKIIEAASYIPIICTSEIKDDHKIFLRKNAIYIRSSSEPFESREISAKEEWEELILRLLQHKEEFIHSDLMAVCKRLVKKEAPIIIKAPRIIDEKKYEEYLRRDKLK